MPFDVSAFGLQSFDFFPALTFRFLKNFNCRHAHPGNPYVVGHVGVDRDLDFPEPMPVVGK